MHESGTRVPSVFSRLNTTPVINACGIYTDLGGSRLSPGVWAAMTEANSQFVRMVDLLESTGTILADRLGAEAGRVTPGAAASIALMVSAAMTGTDGGASERLPDTRGLRNEIVLQRNHRYKYDRQVAMSGARVVVAGGEDGTTVGDLEAAITPRTAAVLVPAHLDGHGCTVRLADLVAVARRRNVRVLVDAAYMCWPLEAMPSYVAAGADLVCFSAKYFGGPNAGGFIVGSRAMIDAVTTNNFTRYESGAHRTFGRPFKMDRQTIVAVVVALEEWMAMDHAARWAAYARWVAVLAAAIAAPGVHAMPMAFTMDERLVPEPVNALVVELGPAAGKTAAQVAAALEQGTPSVVSVLDGDRLVFCMDALREDEIAVIAARFRHVLGA